MGRTLLRAAALLAVVLPAGARGANLAYRFEAGREYRFTVNQASSLEFFPGTTGPRVGLSPETGISGRAVYRVLAVRPDGAALLEGNLAGLEPAAGAPGQPPSGRAAAIFRLSVTPDGRRETLPGPGAGPAGQLLPPEIFFPRLPGTAVTAGSTWEETRTVSLPGADGRERPVETRVRFTCTGMTGRDGHQEIRVAFTGEPVSRGREERLPRGSSRGELVFYRGVFVAGRAEAVYEGEQRLAAPGSPGPETALPFRVRSRLVFSLDERAPGSPDKQALVPADLNVTDRSAGSAVRNSRHP